MTRAHRGRPFRYWRPAVGGVVEVGLVRGREVALPAHFHDEAQLVFVLAGRRHLVIGAEPVTLGPGEGLMIPAGTPHRSLADPGGVACINLYAAPGALAGADLLADLGRARRRSEAHAVASLSELLGPGRPRAESPWTGAGPRTPEGPRPTVGDEAARAGLSREGFTRRFRRLHGLPPQASWRQERLNDARRLLRAGWPPAAVAAETGFADQSHLGRSFLRAFGVTPGRFLAGAPGSHPF